MTIPKKGSREIVVDNIAYRWRIRWKPSYSQACEGANLNAAVELFEDPQSVLHISFPWIKYDPAFGVAEKSVTPKHIEFIIRKALEKGWSPNKNATFKVIHEAESV